MVTLRASRLAFFLGIILAVVLAAANAYLGLFAGMTVSASIPAAVVSMGILRLWKRSNILENNIVQTAASAGESLAAGVIFTLPALVNIGIPIVLHFITIPPINIFLAAERTESDIDLDGPEGRPIVILNAERPAFLRIGPVARSKIHQVERAPRPVPGSRPSEAFMIALESLVRPFARAHPSPPGSRY